MPQKPRSRRRKRLCKEGYRSKFEVKVADALSKANIQATYESESLPYSIHLTYKPDWKVSNGVYVEAKGRFDYEERRKILAVIKSNPAVKVHMIFMRNNKIRRDSPTTYGDWCDKHNIPWTVYPEMPNLCK